MHWQYLKALSCGGKVPVLVVFDLFSGLTGAMSKKNETDCDTYEKR